MTKSIPIYRAIAQAVAAENVTTHFTLMGDGNMHFATALDEMDQTTTIHMRHEHCTVAAAMAWSGATGGIGLASVTCGPGVTQLMTALTQAARSRVPLVCFAGEAPIHKPWYSQDIDQAALVAPTGAHYVAARSAKGVLDSVQRAFHLARNTRMPVVLGVPYDMQKEPAPDRPYIPSISVHSGTAALAPNPQDISNLTALLAQAKRPIILAGKGVIASGAAKEIEHLADASGALLANTLPAMGLFDHHPYSIGVSGGYSREYAAEVAGQADLVIAFGASLSTHTLDGGKFFGAARTIQVDPDPQGLFEGVTGAQEWVVADAGLTAAALSSGLKGQVVSSELRTQDVAARLARDVNDSAPRISSEGEIDPRSVIEVLDRVIPKDYQMVAGNGHQAFWQAGLRGFQGGNVHVYKNFSAIGSGLSFAIGTSVATGNDRVAFIEGDGSLMMHAQEFDTIRRHGLKMLIIVMNDGAYGSEIHKLRAEGLDDSGAVHGVADFGSIAHGFGLRGVSVTDIAGLETAVSEYEAGDGTMVINVHISDKVASPRMRRQTANAPKA